MKEHPDERFSVYLKNGAEVRVDWTKDYFEGEDDHLELHGPMTSTGYRSEFISKGQDREAVIEHARQLAQKCWNENKQKYGQQLELV